MAEAQPAPITPPLAAGWAVYCLLMVVVGLQDRWYAGQGLWPWPVFYELSSMAVATAVAVWRWRRSPRDDPWLGRPWRWFWRVLRWTPPVALVFVVSVYALRHAVRAVFGLGYAHQPWPGLLAYECSKFAIFYALFAGVQFGLRSFRALAAERLRAERLERLSSEARLAMLTQQMQPHFLFNALNTVAALVHEDADAADAALVRLSSLLRAATEAARAPTHPLAEELRLARAYAELMQQRFGSTRVRLQWQLDAPPAAVVPALSLQPLLENAFVHAVERRSALTTISVLARRAGPRLTVEVEDDGPGLQTGSTPGIALANLRERLQALHGAAATLTLGARAGGGTFARLELPCDG